MPKLKTVAWTAGVLLWLSVLIFAFRMLIFSATVARNAALTECVTAAMDAYPDLTVEQAEFTCKYKVHITTRHLP